MAVLNSCLKVFGLVHKTNETPNFKDNKKFNDKLIERGLSQVIMIPMLGASYVPQKSNQRKAK
jgi:hypothetical protein